MRPIADREKRLIRYATAGIAVYLALFFIWKPLQKQRAEYRVLVDQAESLRQRVEPYEGRARLVQKLMDEFHLDPAQLKRSTVVGEASAALQKVAAGSGIQVGPVRESPARSSGKELTSLQLEGTGTVQAIMALLKQIETLGYPMIIDSVQIAPDKRGPNQLKMNLTIVILDFERWSREGEAPHA